MTLSPAFSGIPAHANARPQSSLGKTSDDRSTGFYSYLRSSAHDDGGEADSGTHTRTVKPHKTEKAEKQADTSQNRDTNDAIAPSPTESVPQPSPLLALLGLPTAQTIDVDQTGKTTHDDGKAVLPSTNAPAKTDADQSAPKDRNRNSDTTVNPAALLFDCAPQLGNTSSFKEDNKLDPVNARSNTFSSGANGNDLQLQATGTPSKDAAPASAPGNLAFALRLSEGELKSKIEKNLQELNSAEPTAGAGFAKTTAAIAVQAAASSELKEQSHGRDNSFGQNPYEVPPMQSQKAADAPQAASEQSVPTTATDLEARQETASSEPVRNVHMQVVGDNNNRVDVRLIDRGGELHVSVKSGDLNLARGLQDHMPELTSRLEQGRFQAEVWMPKLEDNAKPEMSGTRDFSSNGNNGSNSSNTDSDQQRKGQQQDKPDWVDVLENSTRGAGRTNQTWLQ